MAVAGTLTYKTELDTSGIQKSGSTVKSIIAGLGITKLISSAMNTIKNSTDDAIKRVDTLNNFPKVMSNLGISVEKSSTSIKKMSDKLAGLPTTLDQGASAVQRFTSANGDVEKSTDIFLALNNAIIAGGASTEIQASALEQMSQAYSKGKPDMMEWRTLMTAMPAQLNQVAKAMGYVSATDLGAAVREKGGEEEFRRMIDTIVELNTTGVDGFANFEQQARNSTAGIGTSITVAKTQIVKGVADIIKGLNDGLAQANLPSISEIISMVGKKAKEALDVVANNLPNIINFLIRISPILKVLGASIIAIVSAITVYQKTVQVVSALTKAWATIQAILNGELILNPIGLLVVAIVGLIAAFVLLWNKSEAFRNFWKGLWEGLKKLFDDWVNGFKLMVESLKKLFDDWVNGFKIIIESLKPVFSLVINWFNTKIQYWINIFRGVINFLTGVFTGNWKQAFNGLKQVASAFINSFLNSFGGLPRRMLSIGLDIVKGIGRGITSGVNWIKNVISSFVGNVTRFIKRMFKIGSPSKLMKDEVGQWLPKGIAVGIEANTDSVENAMKDMYKEMDRTIKIENNKLNIDAISGNIYNKSFYQTPVSIDLNANVEMDSQKVGRLVTPSVTKTIKNGGGI